MTEIKKKELALEYIGKNYTNWIGRTVTRPSDFPAVFDIVQKSKKDVNGIISCKLTDDVSMNLYAHGMYIYSVNVDDLHQIIGDEPYIIETKIRNLDIRDIFMENLPFGDLMKYTFRWGKDWHRTGGRPVYLSKRGVMWRVDGYEHRTDGPSDIHLKNYANGSFNVLLNYSLSGNQMTKTQFTQWYEMTHLEEYTGL